MLLCLKNMLYNDLRQEKFARITPYCKCFKSRLPIEMLCTTHKRLTSRRIKSVPLCLFYPWPSGLIVALLYYSRWPVPLLKSNNQKLLIFFIRELIFTIILRVPMAKCGAWIKYSIKCNIIVSQLYRGI